MLWTKEPFVASTHDSRMCRSEGGVNNDKLQGNRGSLTAHIEKLSQ